MSVTIPGPHQMAFIRSRLKFGAVAEEAVVIIVPAAAEQVEVGVELMLA